MTFLPFRFAGYSYRLSQYTISHIAPGYCPRCVTWHECARSNPCNCAFKTDNESWIHSPVFWVSCCCSRPTASTWRPNSPWSRHADSASSRSPPRAVRRHASRFASRAISSPISRPASSASPWLRSAWAGLANRRLPRCSNRCSRAWSCPRRQCTAAPFSIGFLIFSALHIVIGEQVPKTFAIRKAEPVSLWVAYPLHASYMLAWPLNWLLNRATTRDPQPVRCGGSQPRRRLQQ